VRAEIDEAAPPAAFDRVAVEQAVLNLLDNAAKYSGDTTEIDVRLSVSGESLVVEVEDHGIGIAEDEQNRIFDRFHRGAHSNRGGYGLGLYIVRHIMEAHGGRVDVTSSAGRGSCFRLFFPRAPVTTREYEHAKGIAG
jgi:signal transduction histidine kinase